MPICRTCRGEYEPGTASRPPSGAPDSGVASAPAVPRVCPRCGSDVSAWEQLDITLPEFIVWEGGILGLMPAALSLAVWLVFWLPRESSLYYFPVLTIASFGISVLLFFVIYSNRLVWWEQGWAAQVYRARRTPVVLLLTLTALAGILLTALWVLLYTTSGRPETTLSKGLFALVYIASYVCLTVAVTLGFVQQYIARLEKYAPPPIFVNTNRLLRVVVEGAIYGINVPCPEARAGCEPDNPRPVYEVLEALRAPESGGIHVLLRECKRVQYPSADGEMQQAKWMEMLWRVQADRWGHVQALRPGSLEPYSAGQRAFREIGRYTS